MAKRQSSNVRVLSMSDAEAHRKAEADRSQSYVKNVKPKTPGQETLMKAIGEHALTIAIGPAGTGKTYLAVVKAVEALNAGKVSRIVITRPVVEAGESLGFLPGDISEKMDPWMRPIYDALHDRMGAKQVRQLLTDGTVEIAPLAYMRGRTLANSFILVDEGQDMSYQQLKMLLTRLGWGSKMVITGDPDQSDLLPGMSGLTDVAHRLEEAAGIGVVRLSAADIVRHPLVAAMMPLLA